MTRNQIRRVLKHHKIPVCFDLPFALLIRGRCGDREFMRLTRRDRQYKAALKMILNVLSRPFVAMFGEPDATQRLAYRVAGA